MIDVGWLKAWKVTGFSMCLMSHVLLQQLLQLLVTGCVSIILGLSAKSPVRSAVVP